MTYGETALAQGPDIEFTVSNLALPFRVQLLGSVATTEAYIDSIGADGLEVTPQYSRFMARLLERAEVHDESYEDGALKRLIRSGHSGFRQDEGDDKLIARFFPRMGESLEQLRLMQRVAGRLAVVLYPGVKAKAGQVQDKQGFVVYNQENAPFKERGFQPKPHEWLRDWKLPEEPDGQSAEDEAVFITSVRSAMAVHGFTQIIWDTGHSLLEIEGYRFKDPYSLCARLSAAGLIEGVHPSVNRTDLANGDRAFAESTRKSKRAFVQSAQAARGTMEGKMLHLIAQDWHRFPVHFGQDRRVVHEEKQSPRSVLRIRRAQYEQKAVVAHVRELVDDARSSLVV